MREVAKAVGLSHSAINYWIEAPDARPRESGKVDEVLAEVKARAAKLSTPVTSGVINEGTSTYNAGIGSNDDLLRALIEPVPIEVVVVPRSGLWSERGVETRMKIGSAFPGAAGLAVLIEWPLGNIKSGSTVIFTKADYAPPNTYLLFENFDNSDQRLIGWIDPNESGIKIQTSSGETYSLTDWKVTHFAHAVMWGHAGSLDNVRYSKTGLGPNSKPQE